MSAAADAFDATMGAGGATMELRKDMIAGVLLGGLLIVMLMKRKKVEADEAVPRCAVLTVDADYDVGSTTNAAVAELMNTQAFKEMRKTKVQKLSVAYEATRRSLAYASTTMCFVGGFLFYLQIVNYKVRYINAQEATLPCVFAGVAAHVLPILGVDFFVSSYIAFAASACLLANYHMLDLPHIEIASGVWLVVSCFVVSVLFTVLDCAAASRKSKKISVLYNKPS
eukprot:TRINITY_DN1269_c2_g1_i2.p1 TRINITY_DN1269_c2_g1~~TRINITY_DN1269_c2_g1_i2.p1  ORF type:complete len:226 (+),score=52.04 TRINITY_DN1269_c2_g1_i2:91-768(+)